MTSQTLILTLALVLGNSMPLIAQTTQPEAVPVPQAKTATLAASTLPESLAAPLKSGDFKQLQATVLKDIEKMSSETPDTTKLLENPAYVQLLCIAEIIRVTGLDSLSSFHGDRTRPYATDFLNRFLGDNKWMQLYLGAGLVPENNAIGLEVMADIWKKHGSDNDFKDYIPLTCGLASIWGAGDKNSLNIQRMIKSGSPQFDVVKRYEFFVKRHRAGELYPGFLNLRPWELRFVAGHHWGNDSYEWIAEQISIPPRRYDGACWFANYTGINFFGDSIQGPIFHMPWAEEVSMAQNMKERGGVCGGLSTLGVLAANAYGIPAFTVGQPGHCAYGFRLKRGEWKGGFGGPDGSAGNNIFGNKMPTSQLLMETVFGDDQKIDEAYRFAFQARAMEQLGQTDKAIKAWEQALEISPVHKFFREELHRLYIVKGTMTPADWYAYAKKSLPEYKGNGWSAAEIFEEPENKFINDIPENERLAWAKAEHELIAETKPSWASTPDTLLDRQFSWFTSDEGKIQFLTDAFKIHMSKDDGDNFGNTLNWAVKSLIGTPHENIFAQAFQNAAKEPTGQTMANVGADINKIKKHYNKAILAAETANSIAAFQAISNAAAPYLNNQDDSPVFTSKPFPGTLVPATECLVKTSTSKWDNPIEHRNVLLPRGGRIHTNAESNPWVIVQLPQTVRPSGIIVNFKLADGNQASQKHVRISTSTDGNTWFPLDETKDRPQEWRVENKKDADAKWIKIEGFSDKPGLFRVRNILIYKK